MKSREQDEAGVELSTICRQLKLPAPDGKLRETDCANAEGLFRIIQSVPSPKAEPFKRWLAKVGFERVQEIENPELATKRTRMLYKLKGYSDDWIEIGLRYACEAKERSIRASLCGSHRLIMLGKRDD